MKVTKVYHLAKQVQKRTTAAFVVSHLQEFNKQGPDEHCRQQKRAFYTYQVRTILYLLLNCQVKGKYMYVQHTLKKSTQELR